jgi:hypothetical protein
LLDQQRLEIIIPTQMIRREQARLKPGTSQNRFQDRTDFETQQTSTETNTDQLITLQKYQLLPSAGLSMPFTSQSIALIP